MNLRIQDLFEITEFYDLSVVIIDGCNVITYANQSACQLFKASRAQLVQQNINSLISLQHNSQQVHCLPSELIHKEIISDVAMLVNLTDLNGNQIALNFISHRIDLIGGTNHIWLFGDDSSLLENIILDLFNRIMELQDFILNPWENEVSNNNLQFLLEYSLKMLNAEYGFVAELGTDLTPNIAVLSLRSLAGSNLNPELRAKYANQLRQINFTSVENTLLKETLLAGRPVIVNEILEHNHFILPDFILTLDNYLLIPLFNDGALIGVLLLVNRENGFMHEHALLLQLLIRPISNTLSKILKPAIFHDKTDLITGVQNRNAYICDFNDVLNLLPLDSEQLIVMINVNNFKNINMYYSIEDGNYLLFSLATRLSVIFGKEYRTYALTTDMIL